MEAIVSFQKKKKQLTVNMKKERNLEQLKVNTLEFNL